MCRCSNRQWSDTQPFKAVIEDDWATLKANDFKVFIVSGGGLDFMRPWTGAWMKQVKKAGY